MKTSASTLRAIGVIDARNRRGLAYFYCLVGLFGTVLVFEFGFSLVSAVCCGLFLFAFIWFIDSLGREFAIAQTMSLLATAQWLVGPVLAYELGYETAKYRMYVDSDVYFGFALPGVAIFIAVLFFFSPVIEISKVKEAVEKLGVIKDRYIYALLVSGFLIDLFSGFIPAALAFFGFLISQVKYVAIIYLLVFRRPYRKTLTLFVLGWLFFESITKGLFHDLLLWSALLGSFISFERRWQAMTRLALVVAGISAIVLVQGLKSEYRAEISRLEPESRVQLFFSMFSDPQLAGRVLQDVEARREISVRLNQGWIVSAVMNHTPAVVPFAHGETVLRALSDSFVPRFLVSKRLIDQSETFRDYSGLEVARYTSFGVSPLGEMWINFGNAGKYLFAFYAIVLCVPMLMVRRFARLQPTLYLWLPVIYLQVIKAETEIAVVLNHMTKAGLVVWMFYWFTNRFLKVRF